MAIKNIIFDLGGVLLDIDLNYCMRQMQALGIDLDAFKKKGMQTPIGTKAAVLGEGMVANGIMHLYQTGDITTEAFLEGVRKYCKEGTTREQVGCQEILQGGHHERASPGGLELVLYCHSILPTG